MEGGTGGTAQRIWSEINKTADFEMPEDMRFNRGHVVTIAAYSVLMVLATVGNSAVLWLLMRRRRARRLDLLLLHLAVADLLVALLMMPLEIGWAAAVRWRAGDIACRLLMVLRTFGLYLSSFVLVCIAIDRYHAVLHPLSAGERRVRVLLAGSWVGAVLASLPQALIFHVQSHPQVPWYEQCVVYGSFVSTIDERLYFAFNMSLMYILPLVTTCWCYRAVIREIILRSQTNEKVRRSGVGLLGRARTRTLNMTITIVVVFFVCWTPYYIMCLWYSIDHASAEKLDPAIQRGLFLFACANSCANPVVYGAFNVRPHRTSKPEECAKWRMRPRLSCASAEISASGTTATNAISLNTAFKNIV